LTGCGKLNRACIPCYTLIAAYDYPSGLCVTTPSWGSEVRPRHGSVRARPSD
jgi:hypothetical protein